MKDDFYLKQKCLPKTITSRALAANKKLTISVLTPFFFIFLLTPLSLRAVDIVMDTTELQILLAQAELKILDNPKEALNLAKSASVKAENLGLYKELMKATRIMGDYYLYTGNTDSAAFYYNVSLKTSKENNLRREEAINLLRLADNFVISRNIKWALEYYSKALALSKLIEEDDLVVGIYNNKAVFYIYEKSWEEALSCLNLGLDFIKTSDKTSVLLKGPFLSNIGVVYEETGEYSKALDYYQQAHAVYLLTNSSYNMALSWHNLGQAYLLLGEVDTATFLLEKAWEIEKESNIVLLEQETLVGLSKAHLKSGNTQEAITLLKKAVELARKLNSVNVLSDAYYQLSLSYNTQQDHINGEKYLKLYKALSDSLIFVERKQHIEDQELSESKNGRLPNTSRALWVLIIVISFSLTLFISFRFLKTPKNNVTFSEEEEPTRPDFLLANNRVGNIPVKISQICWLEKDNKKCRIITRTEEFHTSKTISELEALLSYQNFFRVNRSVIINLDFMEGYSFWEYDKYVVRMKGSDRKTFIMSRDRLKALTKLLKINEK